MVQEHEKIESKNSGTRLVSICPTMVLGPMLQTEACHHEQSAALPHVSVLCGLYDMPSQGREFSVLNCYDVMKG